MKRFMSENTRWAGDRPFSEMRKSYLKQNAWLVLVILALVSFALARASGEEFALARNGRALAPIVIAPTPPARNKAVDLSSADRPVILSRRIWHGYGCFDAREKADYEAGQRRKQEAEARRLRAERRQQQQESAACARERAREEVIARFWQAKSPAERERLERETVNRAIQYR
jgi:hypothetical protein